MAEGAGILIVGAAVGFGGKLIRTVSFFGWILPDSLALGGAGGGVAPGPVGIFGLLSAISVGFKLRFYLSTVNSIAPPARHRGSLLRAVLSRSFFAMSEFLRFELLSSTRFNMAPAGHRRPL